jgi:hypothetical protein
LHFRIGKSRETIAGQIDGTDATIKKELANVLKLGFSIPALMNDLLTGRVRVLEGMAITE